MFKEHFRKRLRAPERRLTNPHLYLVIPCQITPLPCQMTSLPCQMTPLPCQMTSYLHSKMKQDWECLPAYLNTYYRHVTGISHVLTHVIKCFRIVSRNPNTSGSRRWSVYFVSSHVIR